MIKTAFATALVTLAITSTGYAATMKKMDHMTMCDGKTMTMMMTAIKKDTDPKMAKDAKMAMDEMHMAAMSKKKHKMHDCTMHIDMAKKHMMMH